MTVRVRHLALAALGLASAGACAQSHAATPELSTTDLSVKMRPGTNAQLVDAAIGAVEVSTMPQIGWRKVRVPASYGVTRALAYYRGNHSVLEANVDIKAKLFADVNDPDRSKQYSLDRMQVRPAWDLTNGGAIIAIIDTGMDFKHPEFPASKLVTGYDFSDDDADATIASDDEYHGVHVAGIAAASTNNAIGVAGIGYNCRVMPLKVFPNSYTTNISKAILYAADNGAKVINMSLGYAGPADTAFGDAITYAVSKGVVVVCAAGNDAEDNVQFPHYPTNYPNVISVAATTSADFKADFSDYGTNVLVAAPGSRIWSTISVAKGSYAYLDGTSMASPAVAGVVGLMRTYAPTATPADIRTALLASTDYIGSFVATGRVNALRALQYLQPPQATSIPSTASGVYGTTLGTVPANLKTKDGKYVGVPMTFTRGLGQTAAYVLEGQIPSQVDFTKYVSSALTFSGKINAAQSTLQVYIYDFSSASYKLVKQATMTTDATIGLPLNQSQYHDLSGKIRIMVRGVVPIRAGNPTSGGVMSLDLLSTSITYRKPL